nr:PREDICTED: small kinetochore-associated protein [Latimeria chalumnae]|eukprot:XP_014340922.1 PREDICTED: small kinetochore-associated protein [Latimeria chalumnae]
MAFRGFYVFGRHLGANPVGRYRVEAELRDRNQLLEAANRDLHLELSGTQNHIQELTEKSEKLESDIKELNQQLESCLVVLETRNIDPVTGSKIVESVEENDRSRAETMNLAQDLQNELANFSSMATEQRTQMQELRSRWMTAKEERDYFLNEMESFQKEMDEFKEVVNEAQMLLEM